MKAEFEHAEIETAVEFKPRRGCAKTEAV